MINSTDYQNLEKLIQKCEIRTYSSKMIAQRFALNRGWKKRDVVLVKRMMDKQWIISKKTEDKIECLLWHEVGSVKLKKETK